MPLLPPSYELTWTLVRVLSLIFPMANISFIGVQYLPRGSLECDRLFEGFGPHFVLPDLHFSRSILCRCVAHGRNRRACFIRGTEDVLIAGKSLQRKFSERIGVRPHRQDRLS